MNLKTVQDKIIVKPDEVEDKVTEGGILIPEQVQDRPVMGEVVAVGPGRPDAKGNHMPVSTKVGDRVFYTRYAGAPVTHEDVDYLVITETDILAIINK
jgi:chaperonin GroES